MTLPLPHQKGCNLTLPARAVLRPTRRSAPASLFVFLFVFLILAPESKALQVVDSYTNSSTGMLDTNDDIVTPLSNIQNADGTYNTIGLPVRYKKPLGSVTNYFVANNYMLTNRATGFWLIFRVTDSSQTQVPLGQIAGPPNSANPFWTLIVPTNLTATVNNSVITNALTYQPVSPALLQSTTTSNLATVTNALLSYVQTANMTDSSLSPNFSVLSAGVVNATVLFSSTLHFPSGNTLADNPFTTGTGTVVTGIVQNITRPLIAASSTNDPAGAAAAAKTAGLVIATNSFDPLGAATAATAAERSAMISTNAATTNTFIGLINAEHTFGLQTNQANVRTNDSRNLFLGGIVNIVAGGGFTNMGNGTVDFGAGFIAEGSGGFTDNSGAGFLSTVSGGGFEDFSSIGLQVFNGGNIIILGTGYFAGNAFGLTNAQYTNFPVATRTAITNAATPAIAVEHASMLAFVAASSTNDAFGAAAAAGSTERLAMITTNAATTNALISAILAAGAARSTNDYAGAAYNAQTNAGAISTNQFNLGQLTLKAYTATNPFNYALATNNPIAASPFTTNNGVTVSNIVIAISQAQSGISAATATNIANSAVTNLAILSQSGRGTNTIIATGISVTATNMGATTVSSIDANGITLSTPNVGSGNPANISLIGGNGANSTGYGASITIAAGGSSFSTGGNIYIRPGNSDAAAPAADPVGTNWFGLNYFGAFSPNIFLGSQTIQGLNQQVLPVQNIIVSTAGNTNTWQIAANAGTPLALMDHTNNFIFKVPVAINTNNPSGYWLDIFGNANATAYFLTGTNLLNIFDLTNAAATASGNATNLYNSAISALGQTNTANLVSTTNFTLTVSNSVYTAGTNAAASIATTILGKQGLTANNVVTNENIAGLSIMTLLTNILKITVTNPAAAQSSQYQYVTAQNVFTNTLNGYWVTNNVNSGLYLLKSSDGTIQFTKPNTTGLTGTNWAQISGAGYVYSDYGVTADYSLNGVIPTNIPAAAISGLTLGTATNTTGLTFGNGWSIQTNSSGQLLVTNSIYRGPPMIFYTNGPVQLGTMLASNGAVYLLTNATARATVDASGNLTLNSHDTLHLTYDTGGTLDAKFGNGVISAVTFGGNSFVASGGIVSFPFDAHFTSQKLFSFNCASAASFEFGVSNNMVVANAPLVANFGISCFASNTLAPASISFPATTVNWTNTTGRNIFVFVGNTGVTGTSVAINGTTLPGGLMTVGTLTLPLQPGEYFSETYTIGTPAAVIKPQ